MGLQIGQVASGLSGFARSQDTAVLFRPPNPPEPLGIGDQTNSVSPFFGEDQNQILTAGFGDGTISVPTAAVRALDTNLIGARQLVPSLEETRDGLRERLSEQRDLFSRDTPDPNPFVRETQPLNLTEGQALARTRAREYINSLGEAARQAQTRLGQETTPRLDVPAVRVGGESFPIGQSSEPTPTIDVRV